MASMINGIALLSFKLSNKSVIFDLISGFWLTCSISIRIGISAAFPEIRNSSSVSITLIESIKLKVENYLLKPINIDELLNSLYDVILPKIQEKEIKKNSNIIKTIGAITDSKQVEIIKYIFNNLDENNNFFGSYSEIMEQFSISKPTLIKLFKDLADKNILIKISHKTYQFDEKSLND